MMDFFEKVIYEIGVLLVVVFMLGFFFTAGVGMHCLVVNGPGYC